MELAPITVFVGPNNSGKSLVLIELENWCKGTGGGQILRQVVFQPLTHAEILEDLVALGAIPSELPPNVDISQQYRPLSLTWMGRMVSTAKSRDLFLAATSSDVGAQSGYGHVRSFYTSRLDGKNRLSLLDEQPLGNLQYQATNFLARLYRDRGLRQRVRQIVLDALGKHFVLDHTDSGKLKVKLSNRAPSEVEENALTAEVAEFYRTTTSIDATSDGIRAFIGIIATLIAGGPKITLIDEPEAFLHPALAMKLGKEISGAVEASKRLFASTHSAAFLMGCIQSGSPVNIIRLTYNDGVGTARVLEKDKLVHLMRNPLLRSTGVLEGLFYEAVIVTEADRDRAFYQEINERLRTANDGRGIGNCLYINAQNKQTVWDVVRPLRELGIPAVGIVDVDMLKDGGDEFTKILKSTFVPPLQHGPMGDTRGRLKRGLDATIPVTVTTDEARKNWWKRNGGIRLLDSSDQQAANSYFGQLEEFGVFVVRNGEVENWLPDLGVPAAHKKEWLYEIFVRMGEDPATYIEPGEGDVWDFIGRIKQWIGNPARFGIPD